MKCVHDGRGRSCRSPTWFVCPIARKRLQDVANYRRAGKHRINKTSVVLFFLFCFFSFVEIQNCNCKLLTNDYFVIEVEEVKGFFSVRKIQRTLFGLLLYLV